MPTALVRPGAGLVRGSLLVALAVIVVVGALPGTARSIGPVSLAHASPGVAMGAPVPVAAPGTPSGVTGAFPPPNWRPLNVTIAPPPAEGGGVAYLPGSSAVVWAGGDTGGTLQTWEFLSGNWTNVTGSVRGAPPASSGGSLASVPFADEVAWIAPFAGSPTLGLWTFANGTWTNDSSLTPAPPARVDGAWAEDPANGSVVLFGGASNGIYRNDTWSLTSSGWSSVGTAAAPSPREFAAMAPPGFGSALVLAGGSDYAGALNDTWTFNGVTWSHRVGADAPVGLATGPNALVPTPGGDVLGYGGVGCASDIGFCNDTYEFLPTLDVWRNVTSQNAPSPREGLALAYDAAAGYILAFGGASGAALPAYSTWAVGGPLVTQLVVAPEVAQPPSSAHYVSHAGGGYGTYTYVYSGQNVDCTSRNVSDFFCPLDDDDNRNYTINGQVTDQMGNVTAASEPFKVLSPLLVQENLSASTVDAGQPVNFSMTVTAPSVPVTIQWLGLPPDCPSANLSAFTCASSVPGFYGVNCTVIDQYGTQDASTTTQLVVHARPTVLAWPSADAGAAPFVVLFRSDVSGGTPADTYNWSFGDGTFGAGASPSHTYLANGTFDVNLTVTDAVGVRVAPAGPVEVVVAPRLSATITSTAVSWSAPARVNYLVSATGGTAPYAYRWTLENGSTGTLPNITTSYAEPGNYTASVTVYDAHGLATTTSVVVTIVSAGSNGASGSGGGAATPAWELAALAVAAAAVGLVLGVVIGRRRPPDSGPT